MINILVHGLGQNESSWDKDKELLEENKVEVETPNLFNLAKNYQLSYENLYKIFERKLHLCFAGIPFQSFFCGQQLMVFVGGCGFFEWRMDSRQGIYRQHLRK